jgi:hypothetical protein
MSVWMSRLSLQMSLQMMSDLQVTLGLQGAFDPQAVFDLTRLSKVAGIRWRYQSTKEVRWCRSMCP